MSDYVLYHNPRCSKSRLALEILRAHGIEPQIIEYFKTPPTKEQLRQLKLPPHTIIRTDEPEYAQLKLAGATDEELLTAIAAHPGLLQRPILVRGDRAVVARPPEKVRELF